MLGLPEHVHVLSHAMLYLPDCAHVLSHVMWGLSDWAHVLSHDARPVRIHTHAVTCDARCLSIYMCCHMKLGLPDCVHVVSHAWKVCLNMYMCCHMKQGLCKCIHVLPHDARSVRMYTCAVQTVKCTQNKGWLLWNYELTRTETCRNNLGSLHNTVDWGVQYSVFCTVTEVSYLTKKNTSGHEQPVDIYIRCINVQFPIW